MRICRRNFPKRYLNLGLPITDLLVPDPEPEDEPGIGDWLSCLT
jgi:hypothetical protein